MCVIFLEFYSWGKLLGIFSNHHDTHLFIMHNTNSEALYTAHTDDDAALEICLYFHVLYDYIILIVIV